MPKANSARPRTVIITQGADPTLIVSTSSTGQLTTATYPVIPIKAEAIVDTNGAGDAFVGGYLSQLVLGKTVEQSVRAGNFLANLVIQRSGATYPDTPCAFE